MRWMGLSSIRIETAGAAGKGKEDATKTVSSRWFLPVVSDDRVRELVEILRPGLVWDMELFDWQPISPRASLRMIRIAVLASFLLGIAGYLSLGWWGIAVGVAAMPPFIWLAIKRSQSKKYTCTDQIVAYRSGILNRKTSMTFFEKIQTVSVYQTPFDRRWDMATLSIDTAAAGPADHKIRIKYLTNETARNQFKTIVEKSSDQQPVFS
jgi:putative membrane protein